MNGLVSLDSILDTVVEVVKYHEAKTEYECWCKVREKLAELRRVDAGTRAEVQRELTIHARIWEFKLKCIQDLIIRDDVSKALWTPFCEDVQQYIAALKYSRTRI